MVESDDPVTECGDGISSLQIHDKQQAHNPEAKTYPIPKAYFENGRQPHLKNFEEYKRLYQESITNPKSFWYKQCNELLNFYEPFDTVKSGSFDDGPNPTWFDGGQLNASYNCVDRHAAQHPDKPAIIYENDEPDKGRTLTFKELLDDVCRLAHVLINLGVRKGDIVAIYLPSVPESMTAILATARIGALHSIVFDGFSAQALSGRITDAAAKVVITADQVKRGGRVIPMKAVVDSALETCPDVHSVLVCKVTGAKVPWKDGRDIWWHETMAKALDKCIPEPMDSEEHLFVLYTSGSTGKPKGLIHSTAGFLLGAAVTGKYVFDVHSESDVFFCAGDVGWITGLVYAAYMPLVLGCTTVIFDGSPLYPTPVRYWDICEKHSVTHFYAAPTALRLLKRLGGEPTHHSLSQLRILASIGEPLAPEVWKWYHTAVGRERAHVLDTYFQTETGSLVLSPLGGVTRPRPGSVSIPFFGIVPALLDPATGREVFGNDVEGVLAFSQPWPSFIRTVHGDHERFLDTYLRPYPGKYFTGDGARRDADGNYWILGRVDDVVNVSGHRISTAEVEAALLEDPRVAEAAAVGIDDEVTGQTVIAFVSLKIADSPGKVRKDLMVRVTKAIGGFAAPKGIIVVDDLPKTRSGKIQRRIMRKMLAGEEKDFGDTTTMVNPGILPALLESVKSFRK